LPIFLVDFVGIKANKLHYRRYAQLALGREIMANGPAYVNDVHGRAPLLSKQFEMFPTVPPRFVSFDNAPVLFSALTTAECEPAGFLARLPRMEAA
jgi:hypothetical protein